MDLKTIKLCHVCKEVFALNMNHKLTPHIFDVNISMMPDKNLIQLDIKLEKSCVQCNKVTNDCRPKVQGPFELH